MKVGLTCVLAVALVAFPADIKGDWPFSPSWPFQHSRFPNTWAPSGAWASTWKNMMNPMSDSAESMEHDPEAEMLPEAIGGTLGGTGGPGWVDFAPSIFRPKFPTSFADLFGNGGFGRPNRRIPWWKGPNICVDKEEVDEEVPEKKDNTGKTESMVVMSKGSTGISISTSGDETGMEDFQLFSVCEQTELQYVCTRKIRKNGVRKTYTEKYHCCHGFERAPNQPGCIKAHMVGLLETVVEMGASDFAELVRSTGLEEKVMSTNMTLFIPSNLAVREYADDAESANQVEFYVPPGIARRKRDIDSGMYEERSMESTSSMKEIVLSHMTPGFVGVEDLYDEQVLYTDNNNSTIRINVYASTTINEKDARGKMHHALMGGKIVTANCACIGNKEEPANSEEMGKRSIGSRRATNGVAHMVDRVLTPVQRTLAEHIASHPRLSKFRALLAENGGKNGPAESLLKALESEKETLTLFAPTDNAFDKLTEEQNEDLFKGKSCTPSILEHHVVGRTLCSAAIPQIQDYIALATTRQGENLRLEWLEGEAGQWVLTIKGSNEQSDKITVTDIDIVATNGVMHLVDSILFPVSARQINQALQDSNLTVFASYLENADMMHDMENFTLFAPTNEAMMKWIKEEDIDEDASALSEEVQDRVKDILKFHLATPIVNSCDMESNELLHTELADHSLRIMVSSSDMFGFGWDKATVQCANILSADKSSCNNVIHVIDRVLIPPSGNVLETISSNPSYSILTKILKGTKLEKELTESNGVNGYTLLAPDDDALGRLEKDQLDGLLEDKKVAERILSAHVIPGVMCCSSVKNPTPWPFTRQQLVNTLAWDVILAVHRDHKGHIHFDKEPVGRGTKVTKCDLAATNGIIHTVNRLIIS